MYAKNPLHINKTLVDFALMRLSNYLQVASQALDEHLRWAKARANEIFDEETEYSLDDPSIDKIYQAAFELRPLLYASFIMMWYGSVEQALQRLCSDLKRQIEVGPDEKYTLRRGIDGAYKFLQDAQGCTVQAQYWQELKTIQKLRNVIVHQGLHLRCHMTQPTGEYTVVDNPVQGIEFTQFYVPIKRILYQYLNRHDMVKIRGGIFHIAPKYDYCEHLNKFAREMFTDLFKDLSSLIN
jgi:hypothetical protein